MVLEAEAYPLRAEGLHFGPFSEEHRALTGAPLLLCDTQAAPTSPARFNESYRTKGGLSARPAFMFLGMLYERRHGCQISVTFGESRPRQEVPDPSRDGIICPLMLLVISILAFNC